MLAAISIDLITTRKRSLIFFLSERLDLTDSFKLPVSSVCKITSIS